MNQFNNNPHFTPNTKRSEAYYITKWSIIGFGIKLIDLNQTSHNLLYIRSLCSKPMQALFINFQPFNLFLKEVTIVCRK